jgi:hypothetical protein
VNNKLSASTQVTSGVIQGSCLGPTLFTVFIDPLLQSFDIPASVYADDVKLIANEAGLSININNTRGGSTRQMQQHVSTVKATSYFKHRAASLWNSIPNNVTLCSSLTMFKRHLKFWLRDIDKQIF